MKYIIITLLCPMKMLDKRIVCINMLVQLLVSCLVSCVYLITTQCYGSHSDRIYTTDLTVVPAQYAFSISDLYFW